MPNEHKSHLNNKNIRSAKKEFGFSNKKTKLSQSIIPSANSLVSLQRNLGNQAFGRFIQPKLKIGEPGDVYEQEADRVADEIMRMPNGQVSGISEGEGNIWRKCAACASGSPYSECEEEGEITIHRKAEHMPDSGGSVPDSFIQNLGPGQPLDNATRNFFEPRFRHDFSHVRVHTDERAAESARAVNALAYTVGRDMVFGEGRYALGTTIGQQLLAHELTHVVQQSTPGPQVGMLQRIAPAAAAGIAGAAAAGFLVGFGAAFGIDYLSMTRERAERYARELDTLYPGWLSSLPNCPCTVPERDTANWVLDSNPNLQKYHPGATHSYRSTAAATGGSRHGQQCTYDAAGRLITSGPAAGTPDVYSPSWGILNVPYHVVYDVKTWEELGWSTYNRYWRPNNGNGCPSNNGSQQAR